ncbi:MAG: 3-deoxy-D-manno-octulosonic acid transferase [Saprospiraceae bacterium]|nr:3-deoxy-D-manno-octulosonic acid transferase [Saprospiraceae bacterium]
MLLYEIIIHLFSQTIRFAAFFDPKARKWVEGRRNWRARLASSLPTDSEKPKRTLWLHAASLGEFEQGRPIIETFRERYPDWRIVLTFFSPSGYEVRKHYPQADLVCYLPADTRRNARDFLDLFKPDAAVFVKYEFWANYLFELKKRGTPTLLVSALFREKQPFFKWYGGFWRKMLGCFTRVFVQNEGSAKLLQRLGLQNFTIAGDNRVDRVLSIAASVGEHPNVAAFAAQRKRVLIAGSTWAADEAILLPVLRQPAFLHTQLIIAPHEPSETNVRQLCDEAEATIRYSQMGHLPTPDSRVLVIDNVGLLNSLYRYGTVAYIGGGFGKGIHNTLEPAAFGLPIIFGPRYQKFEEARQFVARGGAFPVSNAEALAAVLSKLEDPIFYEKASRAVRGYLEESKGATDKVLRFLESIQDS